MELVKRSNNEVATRRIFQKGAEWILADISESMDHLVPNTNKTRLDLLNETINSYGEHIQTVAFSKTCSLHIGPVSFRPQSTTHMDRAFQRVKEYQPNYILVISDGRTKGQDECLEIAQELSSSCLIDTLYIGPDDPSAEDFMRSLATIGNGRFRKFDLSKPQTLSLTSVVQGFLPAPEEVIES